MWPEACLLTPFIPHMLTPQQDSAMSVALQNTAVSSACMEKRFMSIHFIYMPINRQKVHNKSKKGVPLWTLIWNTWGSPPLGDAQGGSRRSLWSCERKDGCLGLCGAGEDTAGPGASRNKSQGGEELWSLAYMEWGQQEGRA